MVKLKICRTGLAAAVAFACVAHASPAAATTISYAFEASITTVRGSATTLSSKEIPTSGTLTGSITWDDSTPVMPNQLGEMLTWGAKLTVDGVTGSSDAWFYASDNGWVRSGSSGDVLTELRLPGQTQGLTTLPSSLSLTPQASLVIMVRSADGSKNTVTAEVTSLKSAVPELDSRSATTGLGVAAGMLLIAFGRRRRGSADKAAS